MFVLSLFARCSIRIDPIVIIYVKPADLVAVNQGSVTFGGSSGICP